jgi:hypothetical protein
MVTALVILNIILIVILLTIAVLYLFRKKKDINTHCITSVCVSDDDNCIEFKKQETNINSERVFVGRFITEDEYQQMMKNRKSDISILLDEVNSEYENLKELNK